MKYRASTVALDASQAESSGPCSPNISASSGSLLEQRLPGRGEQRVRAARGPLPRRQVEEVLEHLVHEGAAHRLGGGGLGQPVDGAQAVEQRAGHEVAGPAGGERAEHVDPVDRRGTGFCGRARRAHRPARLLGDRHGPRLGGRADSTGGPVGSPGVHPVPPHRSSAPRGRRPAPPPGTLRLATVGGTQILISYTVLLFAALFAVVLGPQVDAVQPGLGPLKYLAGAVFAMLLYLAVLLHEASHALMARRYGVQVPSITLHFLGGMTAVQGEARTPRQEFAVAVVGPLTSLAVGAASYVGYEVASGGLVRLAFFGLAVGNLLIGALNLLPGLPLDGGRVFKAVVWAVSGSALRGVVVAAWAGRATAVLILSWPWVSDVVLQAPPGVTDYLVAVVLAAFIWTTAGAELGAARLRQRVPSLVARDLARRVLAVPDDLPLAEAVRRAGEARARSIVTVTAGGHPVGVVNDAALEATPEERRPWVPVSSVTRRLDDGLRLPVGLRGEELVAALGRRPAHEYLLMEEDGSVYGVLATTDVDKAVRGGRER